MLTPMKGRIGRHALVGRSRPDARRSVSQFLLDLGDAEGQKLVNSSLRLRTREASNEMSKCPHGV